MINILLFLFFVGCISLSASMIADNPGTMTMVWAGYQIDTSVAFIIFSLVLLSIILIILTLIIRRIVTAPSEFWRKRNANQLKSGISELTYGIAALASSNIDAAEKHVIKVERLIGRSPLTLLLSAQIAKNRGNEAKTQKLLEQLLEHKETEYLAARSLSDSASKQDNLPKALHLAIKAQGLNPKDNHSAMAVIGLNARLKKWNEAFSAIDYSKLPRKEKKRVKAIVQIAYGKLLLGEERYEEALPIAKNVISVLPYFAPAIEFSALTYNKNNMAGAAIKLVTKAWKKNPSSILTDVFNEIISSEPTTRQEKLRSKLSGDAMDVIWNCHTCTHKQIEWKLHCDSCNSFNSLEWK